MTEETNAAIRGAFDAGATEVLVSDSHGYKTNILIELLDPRAELITGDPRLFGMMEGIDASFGAVVFVGYHAGAGAMGGILDHTNSTGVAEIRLDGIRQNEGSLNAALAGHFGVPVVYVSGDNVAVDEVRALVGAQIAATVVKRGVSRSAARSMSVSNARRAIQDGVKRGVESRDKMPVHRVDGPVTFEIEFTSTANVTHTEQIPGVRRINGRTIAYTAPDLPTAYKLIRVLVTLGARK
jgi:D-amino peptidase